MSLLDDRDRLYRIRQQVEASVEEIEALLGKSSVGEETERPVCTTEEQEAVAFYRKCRSHCEHEDHLVNQRLTWLLALHGLLFTAYGFTISGEASALIAPYFTPGATPIHSVPSPADAYRNFATQLASVREGMIWLGVLSSLAVLFGIVAAFRVIRDMNRQLPRPTVSSRRTLFTYPHLIGGMTCNVLGMTCGLLIPFLTAGVWMFIAYRINAVSTPVIYGWIGGMAAALLLSVWFVFFGKPERTTSPDSRSRAEERR